MQIKSFTTGAAVLLAFVPSVFAGTARVINNCGVPVYYASVARNNGATMQLLPAGGYSESFGANGVGVSIKLAPTQTGAHTQFEFTPMGNMITYDMSNIDGYPFSKGGMVLAPSVKASTAFPSCVSVNCAAGQAVCGAAYNQPDDVRTLVCSLDTDLTLTLCSGGPMKREEESSALVARAHARQFPRLT